MAEGTPKQSSPMTADEISMLPAHRRVSLEYRLVLKQIAGMLRLDPTGATALDVFGMLEIQLEQRVAALVDQARHEGYHRGQERIGELHDENDRLRVQLNLMTRDRHAK